MTKAYSTPGPRAIYPDVCTSPSLAAVDTGAQLLFERLLVLADDQGRVQAQPDWLKANAMPFVVEASPRRIRGWLEQLARQEVLILYTVNRVDLAQFVTWWKRQAGLRRAYPSRWPPPPGWNQDRVYGLPTDNRPGTRADPNRPHDEGDETGPTDPDGGPEQGESAGKVRADRAQSAGSLPAALPLRARDSDSRSDSDSRTPPNPPRRGGRRRTTSYDEAMVLDDSVEVEVQPNGQAKAEVRA
jgi:hypothetical protein